MNILAIVQRAVLLTDLETPQSLFASTERTWQEMANVVNIAALQILDDYDWQRQIRLATVTGDGIASSFPLPSDYSRMVKDGNLIGPNWIFDESQQVSSYNEWLQWQNYAVDSFQQRWMIFGDNLNLMPTLPSADTLSYGYISNAIVTGADASTFTADTDEFVLDDELLRLAIVWNWKDAKGYDFASDLGKYSERLEKLRFRDKGAAQTIIGGRSGARWPTGVTRP